jgi:hypothetical protein
MVFFDTSGGMPMTLYHGSTVIIQSPELHHSIKTLDFGPGFYTTTNREQAVGFTQKVYEREVRQGRIPEGKFVSLYETDYEAAKGSLDILSFDAADETWFDFVMENRRNIYRGRTCDIVYGPVANDTIYNILIAFETGVLSKTETIARLKIRKLYNQMTFKTEQALMFLRYTGFLEVSP